MKFYFSILLFLSFDSFAKYQLSKDIFKIVPFSTQYSKDQALIMNIDFQSINALIPQIEKKYPGVKLQTRGEAHITVLTPPEALGWFNPDSLGTAHHYNYDELLKKYSKTLQSTKFTVKCLGLLENENNKVFFLVIDSPGILKVRREIQAEVERRAREVGRQTYFDAEKYYPHITIGFIEKDIHNKPKTVDETCPKPPENVMIY